MRSGRGKHRTITRGEELTNPGFYKERLVAKNASHSSRTSADRSSPSSSARSSPKPASKIEGSSLCNIFIPHGVKGVPAQPAECLLPTSVLP